MSHFFSRLFGRSSPDAAARGPLGLHLHAGFTLDTLAFRLCEDALLISLPGEDYTVAACGVIDAGAGCMIHRYYTSGDEFLQINTAGGLGIENIEDIKFFMYEESSGVSRESTWREMLSADKMGKPGLTWMDHRWQRFFETEEKGNISPLYLLENVVNHSGTQWEVHNFMMGYQREVATDFYEYLLLNGEETFDVNGEPEWIFSRAIGVDIPLTSLNIIG